MSNLSETGNKHLHKSSEEELYKLGGGISCSSNIRSSPNITIPSYGKVKKSILIAALNEYKQTHPEEFL
jgi:hypothetical protein